MNIYGVVWHDFVPLSLPCPDAATAIRVAQEMERKSRDVGVTLHYLKAVRVDETDRLHTLWESAA